MKNYNKKYLLNILSIIFKEKYVLMIIFAAIFSSYYLLGGKYSGEATKGRFSIKVGSYLTIDRLRGIILTQVEKPEYLISYLKSYEFFSSLNKKCTLKADDMPQRNYVVRKSELYVDVILRFSEREKILLCLEAIEDNINKRHEERFQRYTDIINYQIKSLREIFKKNYEELPSEKLRQSSIMNLQEAITPLILQRNSVIQTFEPTLFLNQRTYQEKSVYYSSTLIGVLISIIMTISIFLVYIFIKYSKKLNF